MFPLSGRLVAASKSNSSTFCPSRTTTRVSSGWLASISMRLGIAISVLPNRARTAGARIRAVPAQEGLGSLVWAPERTVARLDHGVDGTGSGGVVHNHHCKAGFPAMGN